jgi:hypothetical protein
MLGMHIHRFAVPAVLLLTSIAALPQEKRAAPPTAKDLAKVWIGFDQDNLTFTRLELHNDSTGYCARVHPADTVLHHYGVELYRVDRWNIEGWNLTFELTPISSNAEPVYLKGQAGGIATLRLEIGGVKTKWKLAILLDPESRIEISNKETKQAIDAVQK